MINEILPDLFRIEIPMPESPLKYLNAYVLKGGDRNLIIDTGLNRKECQEAMEESLDELAVDLEKTDFFITHMHADHFALVSKLVRETGRVYFNRPDTEFMQNPDRWDSGIPFAGMNGFPEHELRPAIQNHPGFKYGFERIPDLNLLKDGDRLTVGDYLFECVETPGHTRGHTCLYEPEKKILVAGDHILIDITPNIQCWSESGNPLKSYLASLDKVYEFRVNMVLPGHRRLFKDHRQRIKELQIHHKNRLDEILNILERGSKNAYNIASEMTWDIDYGSWDRLPVIQRWFATGEAIAHLRFLEEKGEILKEVKRDGIRFTSKHESTANTKWSCTKNLERP